MSAPPRLTFIATFDWRRHLRDKGPGVVFAASLLTVIWLWGRSGQSQHLLGEVEALKIAVAADSEGLIRDSPASSSGLFDRVEKGQVLARLDDRRVAARLLVLQTELARLRSETAAATARAEQDESDRQLEFVLQTTRVRFEIEQRRIALLERRLEVENEKFELQRCDERLAATEQLVAKRIEPRQRLTDERLRRDQIAARLAESECELTGASQRLDEALEAFDACQPPTATDVATLTAPLRDAIEVHEAKIREVQTEIDQLVVRAPVRGKIAAIHHWPGEYVKAGEPILSITPDDGRCVISYLRQELRVGVEVGDQVELRPWPSWGQTAIGSAVLEVGPQLEPLPPHHCRDPRVPEWGLPLRIALPDGLRVRPGELLDVKLMGSP